MDSEFDDIEGGPEGDDGSPAGDGAEGGALEAGLAGGAACLSCGNATAGPFCAWCGQKNDDLRRSSFVLARDFMRDTFGFDSRMWRTLGLMAIAPGVVPKNYAHGKRSRFTPPVRMFLVVSFLFFLTIALTNTLFVALEVRKADPEQQAAAVAVLEAEGVELPENSLNCGLDARPRFFVKEKDLQLNEELWAACIEKVRAAGSREIQNSSAASIGESTGDIDVDREVALTGLERILSGAQWLVEDPRALNNSFNNWLPRVLFFMTPVLALILTVFIRGKDALIFDHLILSFYTHAAAFAIIAIALILAQLGVANTGAGAFLAIALYYFVALKRAYGRGWIKTTWTAIISGTFYWLILLSILTAIISNIIWEASG